MNDALSDGININKPWFNSLNIFIVSKLESFTTLLDSHIRIITATTETSNTRTPSFKASDNIATTLL